MARPRRGSSTCAKHSAAAAKVPPDMVEASPSRSRRGPEHHVSAQPRLRWSRLLAWVGLTTLGLALVAAVVVWTAPRWAGPRVEAELEQRLGARLDARVDIGELALDWERAELRDVELTREGVTIHVDQVLVTLDRAALWSARFEVLEVEAVGGFLEGTRAGVEALARALQGMSGETEREQGGGWLRRRTRLTPNALEIRRLSFSITDGSITDGSITDGSSDDDARRVTGTLAATINPEHERVELRITRLLAELGLGRPLRAASVRTTLEQVQGELRFPISLEVSGVAAEVNDEIAVAGVHGSISTSDAKLRQITVALAGGFAESQDASAGEGDSESGDLWSVSGRFERDLSAGKIAVDMEAFELGRMPQVLASLPVVESEKATVGGHLELDFGAGVAKLDGQLKVAGLNVSHRLLAREVVRDVGLTIDVDAKLDPAARRLEIERLAIGREGVELIAHGELVHAAVREDRRYRVAFEVPEVACQAVLDAIPRELVPGLVGFELEGNFSAQLAINADFSKLDELELNAEIGIDGCRVSKAPRLASAERLNHGFVHRVTMRDGRTRRLSLYPGSSSYTPLAQVSRYMTEAVLTTEDGGFRRHDGFNRSQIEVALRRNLQAGRVRLGASTITMQMVKNVLLSHERTLSRKLQELFLTWWVEQSLSKQRIMELYLNVIEFGPGVYGVSNASRHYFGKLAGELTSREAAYLALMLPSPVRRHVHYCNGELDERFTAKLRFIHDLMFERERITASEHAVYAAIPLEFDLLERGAAQACHDEIEALLAGSQTQRALSGLLGDRDDTEVAIGWAHGGVEPSLSWGVRPPLPDYVLPDPNELAFGDANLLPSQRLVPGKETDNEWMAPSRPNDRDPANSDAPGRPAMDEPPWID